MVKSTELSGEEVAQAQKRGQLDKKFKQMIKEVLWQLILLALMLWVVMGNQDGNVYYQNQHIRHLFVDDMPTVSETRRQAPSLTGNLHIVPLLMVLLSITNLDSSCRCLL